MANRQETSLTRRETQIPGFRLLLDSPALGDLLGRRLNVEALRQLRVDYLRYKPGVNCIARFGYTLDGASHWGYAKAFGPNARSKLEKAARRPASDGPLGPGRLIDHDLGLMACLLPTDNRLRSLYRLADSAARDALLARIFDDAHGWTEARCTPLNYKPERRFVARFTGSAGHQALVKIYTEGEFERIRKYRKRLRHPDSVRMPEWIGGSKAHQALAFSWLPGNSLSPSEAAGNPGFLEAAGEAIAHFHGFEQPGLKRTKLKHVKARLQGLADELAVLVPELAAPAGRMADALWNWRRAQDDLPLVPVHGDFYHRQLVVDGDGIALIDSDDTHRGMPLSDLGNFAAHLERAAIGGLLPANAVEPALEALCNGYRRQRSDSRLERLNQAAAYRLFHLLHDPFRERAAGWPEKTGALLQRCAELFES